MADTYDFTIEQGTDVQFVVTYKDDDGNPINLSGYTARMKIKKSIGGTTVLSLTNGSGITLGGALGTVTVDITNTQTKAMDFTIAVYDLEIISGASKVTRLLQGSITLSKEITDE